MKIYQYFFTALLSCGLLISCDSSGTNEIGSEIADEGEVVQTHENIDMEETDPNMQNIEVVAQNLSFAPNELRVKPGQKVQITLVNKGETDHNIKFELPEGEQELRENVQPGKRAGLRFTTPEKKGIYTFYSPVASQKDRGMTGKLVVE